MAGTDFDSFLESLQAVEQPLESPSVASDEIEYESTREIDLWRDFIDPNPRVVRIWISEVENMQPQFLRLTS